MENARFRRVGTRSRSPRLVSVGSTSKVSDSDPLDLGLDPLDLVSDPVDFVPDPIKLESRSGSVKSRDRIRIRNSVPIYVSNAGEERG